jgi:hypothetical protein
LVLLAVLRCKLIPRGYGNRRDLFLQDPCLHRNALCRDSGLYISYPKTANPTGVNEPLNGGVAGTILYYAQPKTSTTVTVNSELVVGSTGKTQVCYPLTATKSSVTEVATTDLSKLPFIPPFKLSL